MKLHSLLANVAIMLACTSAWAGSPAVNWISTTHDFGAFDEDLGPVTTYFKGINTGDAPLMIMGVRASCGCTSPVYSKKPVQPGDTATVAVTYNPAGRPGKFDKTVKVETNATKAPVVLHIRGTVIGDRQTLRAHYPVDLGVLKLRNTVVQIGDVTKGRTKTAFLDGYNQSADTIRPTLLGLPPYIAADVAPTAVPPGQQVTFTVFYDTSRAKELWGLNTTDIKVKPDTKSDTTGTVSVVAIVNEDFSQLTSEQLAKAPSAAYSSPMIDLGRVKRGSKVDGSVTIENFGDNALLLRRVSCPDDFVTIHKYKDKVGRGAKAVINITVDTRDIRGNAINSRLTIVTNDPKRPSVPIRIVGELLD